MRNCKTCWTASELDESVCINCGSDLHQEIKKKVTQDLDNIAQNIVMGATFEHDANPNYTDIELGYYEELQQNYVFTWVNTKEELREKHIKLLGEKYIGEKELTDKQLSKGIKMKNEIILVEFDSGDGVEAEAFLTKQSLIEWYHEVISGGIDVSETFDNLINSEANEFSVNSYDYNIRYGYKVF